MFSFYFIYFYLVNISYSVTYLKLFNTLYHQKSWTMNLVWIMQQWSTVERKLHDYVMTIWNQIFSLSIIILHVLHNILNNCYGLEINQTNDFRLLIYHPFLSYYFSFHRPSIFAAIQEIIKRLGLQEDFCTYFCRISMYQLFMDPMNEKE